MQWKIGALPGPDAGQVLFPAAVMLVLWYILSAVRAWYGLRKFPCAGRTVSFSYLWTALTMGSGRVHQILLEQHRKRGPVLRLGPRELVLADGDTFARINSPRSTYERAGWYDGARFDPYGHSILSEPNRAKHDARKAQLAGGFAGKGRAQLDRALDVQLAMLTSLIRTKYLDGRIFDIGRLAQYFTVDVTTHAGVGEPWGNLAEDMDKYHFLHDTEIFAPAIEIIATLPLARTLFYSKFFLGLIGPSPDAKDGLGRMIG